ncbi:MAG: Rod shape-determining protein MreB [Candidatus Kapaibacterium sp.]|jgi:rod shape-determining protein MreB|nr:MAG: Rod shape-determining protein MreB [Candidatus Kapabacteria bacterium]ROL58264.1 MAG: rod shape-determining protein [Bacteroidetes/Chlorobi group bacterium Naka2016]
MIGFLSADLAIDLGTANTLIYLAGENKIVLNEPSIVAFNRISKNIIAVGKKAKEMLGRTPRDIQIIRPLQDGAIADFEITENMLRLLIKNVTPAWHYVRKVVVCVPQGITEVEKRAVRDSCEHAGAKEVYLISEPMAGAIGAGINVSEPKGNLIVDIGGGTTEIAVISLSGVVVSESIKIAGDEMTEAIKNYFKKEHNILIGDTTAENIKIEIGSAYPLEEEAEFEVTGRNLVNGLPKSIVSTSEEVRKALLPTLEEIVNAILRLLERTPPELSSDIYNNGIVLNGGGALLKGIDKLLEERTSLPVHITEDPLKSVVLGAGKVLENISAYSQVLIRGVRY